MKNNRLIISYRGMRVKSNYQESLRVTSYDRAKEIVASRSKDIVHKAVFKDSWGTTYKIK